MDKVDDEKGAHRAVTRLVATGLEGDLTVTIMAFVRVQIIKLLELHIGSENSHRCKPLELLFDNIAGWMR